MKILIATSIVITLARLVSGFVMMLVNLPFGIIFERWGDRSPHLMKELRLRIRAIFLFSAMVAGVVAAVIFSYYIFHVVAHTESTSIVPLISVTIPMLFSIRAHISDWKNQYANAWNKENDVSDDFRRHVDSEVVTIHRVGVFSKACAVIVSWIYFFILGDQINLPYLGIK